jgi:hypothetical protein
VRSGAVTRTFAGISNSATASNSTVCRRYGVLWAYGHLDEDVTLTGATTAYVRGDWIEFYFCPSCGCVACWRAISPGHDGRRRIAVNLQLSEAAPIADVPVRHFDGFDTFEALPGDGRCVADYWVCHPNGCAWPSRLAFPVASLRSPRTRRRYRTGRTRESPAGRGRYILVPRWPTLASLCRPCYCIAVPPWIVI